MNSGIETGNLIKINNIKEPDSNTRELRAGSFRSLQNDENKESDPNINTSLYEENIKLFSPSKYKMEESKYQGKLS